MSRHVLDLAQQLYDLTHAQHLRWGKELAPICEVDPVLLAPGQRKPKGARLRELLVRSQLLRVADKCRHLHKINGADLSLDIHEDSTCEVEYEGGEYKLEIGGAVGLIGTVWGVKGREEHELTIYHRFIGKTFWQYVRLYLDR